MNNGNKLSKAFYIKGNMNYFEGGHWRRDLINHLCLYQNQKNCLTPSCFIVFRDAIEMGTGCSLSLPPGPGTFILYKTLDKRYLIVDHKVARHFLHYSECLSNPLSFYATQMINPFPNSRISANHDKVFGF